MAWLVAWQIAWWSELACCCCCCCPLTFHIAQLENVVGMCVCVCVCGWRRTPNLLRIAIVAVQTYARCMLLFLALVAEPKRISEI